MYTLCCSVLGVKDQASATQLSIECTKRSVAWWWWFGPQTLQCRRGPQLCYQCRLRRVHRGRVWLEVSLKEVSDHVGSFVATCRSSPRGVNAWAILPIIFHLHDCICLCPASHIQPCLEEPNHDVESQRRCPDKRNCVSKKRDIRISLQSPPAGPAQALYWNVLVTYFYSRAYPLYKPLWEVDHFNSRLVSTQAMLLHWPKQYWWLWPQTKNCRNSWLVMFSTISVHACSSIWILHATGL